MHNPEAAILERAKRLCNIDVFAVALQCRRVVGVEPEDGEFLFRRLMDFQFLIVALCRLRRSAKIALGVPFVRDDINAAITRFDETLPTIRDMRNVAEHIDEYALEGGHNPGIQKGQLEVGYWNDKYFCWLDRELNLNDAHHAAEELFDAVRQALKAYIAQQS